jgi:spore coat polysaccharide biosynthesis protein SpsF (cytidylyltransferase family)
MHYCFITVRLNSSRLKKKCLLKLKEITILDHIILRLKKFNLMPVICTTNLKVDKSLNKYANKYKIKIYLGSNKNKIKRWLDCAKKYKVKKFHTIDADDIFFDHINIKKSMMLLNKVDIVKPSSNSRKGAATEGYSFKTVSLNKIINKMNLHGNNLDTEMIDNIVKKSSKFLKIVKLENARYITKKSFRLTLDYKEDFILLKKIYSKFGSYESRKNINFYLNKNLDLRNINFFRNIEWKNKQMKQLKNG